MEILNSNMATPTAPFFLSAPSSPDRHLLDALLFSDNSETSGDFEFDTSQRYCFQEEHVVSFADKVFSNGTVLPLQLPPSLRDRTGSPTGSSPGSVLKAWQNLWRTDVDPFSAALEKVKMEDRRGRRWESFGRRARSLSPFRGVYGRSREDLSGLKSTLLNRNENKSLDHLGPLEGQVVMNLAQPKGLEIARKVRLVEIERTVEQNTSSSATTVRKNSFMRRLSFKSNISTQLMEKKISEMVKFKMDFLRSKPKLLCLGYGMKTNS